MVDEEEMFEHTVEPWTVGRLRAAIEGMADDLPVSVLVPPAPGGDGAESRVVADVSLNAAANLGSRAGGDVDEVRKVLLIECDYPSGSYYRRKR